MRSADDYRSCASTGPRPTVQPAYPKINSVTERRAHGQRSGNDYYASKASASTDNINKVLPRIAPWLDIEPSHPKNGSVSKQRALPMIYASQDGPRPSRQRPPPSGPLPPTPRDASGSRGQAKKKEHPVPVQSLDSRPKRADENELVSGYQFPPRATPRHDSIFAPSFVAPNSPATSMSAAMPDSPTLGPASKSFGGLVAPSHGPAASRHAPQRAGNSPFMLVSARLSTDSESVYCSTGTPTVRRQGAIKRTMSSGEAGVPLPIQHARHRSERTGEAVTTPRHMSSQSPTAPTQHSREPPARTLRRVEQHLPSSPSRLPESARDHRIKSPDVKPHARNVPRDVEKTRSRTDSLVETETPRSSLQLATASMVEKVQGTMSMHMREAAGARPVKMSSVSAGGADLHRAKSSKADVQMKPAPTPQQSPPNSPEGAVLMMSGGRKGAADLDEERRADVAAWVNSLARPTREHATQGVRPLNIRKRTGA